MAEVLCSDALWNIPLLLVCLGCFQTKHNYRMGAARVIQARALMDCGGRRPWESVALN